MANEGVKRKISAILSADVVGYSRLMESDEETTVRTLESYRNTISSLIQQHHGRVIDSPGDNLLAEFGSVVDAVQCAVEIQHVIKAKNSVLPESRRMEFRIGINLGDIIEEGDRIYGDGVNIAARIEGLAEAGGICISGSVYEQIENKLALPYENLGSHTVKNISRPIRVYRIPIESRSIAETNLPESQSPTTKPSIAVLPFVNMSNDPDQEYFSDGMAEEILNGLANNQGLLVKARTSSFAFKGQNQDIRKIGETLNVTHIVEGSVRKSGNRIRITAQLINAAEDVHIWSDRYDRELTDIFEIQDEIADSILNELNIHLVGLPDKKKPIANLEAYNAYLLARYLLSHAKLHEAETELKRAILLDPNNADIYGLLSLSQMYYIFGGINPASEIVPKVRNHMLKALSINESQIDARIARLYIHFFSDHAYQDAINECAHLIRQHTNVANLLAWYSAILITIGRFDLALRVLDRAAELDPLSPDIYFTRGVAFFLSERYDEAMISYERAEMLGYNASGNLAALAASRGDIYALHKLLERGPSNWPANHRYSIYQALASYMEGDHNKVKEILSPLWQTTSYLSFCAKRDMAALEGNLDLALDYYEQALSESEYTAFIFIQMPLIRGRMFPDYRSHPKYQKILKDVGLDDESIAKLKIPPLPF